MLTLVYSDTPVHDMSEFYTHFWKLRLPDDWAVDQDPDCHTAYNPDGPGVVQISALKQSQPVTTADLNEFAREHIDSGAKMQKVTAGSFNGITIDYDVDKMYWREWYLMCDNVFLFITYHCPIENEGSEDDVVDSILDTLQLRDPSLS